MFKKGDPRPAGAGMKPGQKTKRTADTAETFAKIVEKYGDPLLALAEMAFDPENDLTIRQSSMKEVVSYGYAKRKALEISGPEGAPLALDMKLELIGKITDAFGKLSGKL
jgi:hypothetical protein